MRKILVSLSLASLVIGCKSNKNVTSSSKNKEDQNKVTPVENNVVGRKPAIYRESRERKMDLIHMRLWISFNYEKQEAYGRTILKVKPYAYPQNLLELDARGMEIKELGLVSDHNQNATKPEKKLDYKHFNDTLRIVLDKTYQPGELFYVFIDYVSRPNQIKSGGSNAITSDKGLFFINPLGEEENKPRQIWTQGETQSNSVWFPTIDAPNEKITHELFITVDNKDVTLSNGLLVSSTDNKNGTRTDYWKMDLPHAPYLVMMAIGEFSIVKDKWRNIAVDYYVEKEFEPYAKAIFGNTPEMLEYYSKLLGVDYPWPKYHQVVVRDYVSGAMENTSATLHGEFLNKTTRELMDEDNQDIIAHELFHQWFGDLVTCESWSNLPLNESFATYGEYLWEEYKNGRDAADYHNAQSLNAYLMESRQKQVNMIRYDWERREDMFDSHSYAKGGRILHMLRKTVGDSAFFKSLHLYLNRNKFKTVEIHDLRLAFEEVTGQDLNWFFNQWFFASGHPKLKITHNYDSIEKKYTITLKQAPSAENGPLYKLPMDVDIYEKEGGVRRERIILTESEQKFTFLVNEKPNLVNVDAEKMLLCTKEEKKSLEEYAFQYKNAPLYLDRIEALESLSKNPSSALAQEILLLAINDKFWPISGRAIELSSKLPKEKKENLKEILKTVASTNQKSALRATAIHKLADDHNSTDMGSFFENIIKNDSSYSVLAACLYGLKKIAPEKALGACKKLENEKNAMILSSIADVYKDFGTKEENQFFIQSFKKLNGFTRYGLVQNYALYLGRMDDETINNGLPVIENIARNEKSWWIRLSGIQALNSIAGSYEEKETEIKNQIDLAATLKDQNKIGNLKAELLKTESQRKKINQLVDNIKKDEKDPNLTRFWNSN